MIDEDELMTTEHNTIFQVSDIVTATEHSDLKNSNVDYGNGDNENGDKEMMTKCWQIVQGRWRLEAKLDSLVS